MPSQRMDRFNIDIYRHTTDEIDRLMVVHNIKRIRFLRECVMFVLSNPKFTEQVIQSSKGKPNSYVKT